MRVIHGTTAFLGVLVSAFVLATAAVHAEPVPVPETPSRQAVVAAMAPVSDAIAACGARAGVRGTVPIRLVFESSGAVIELTIPPEHESTELGLCFRDAARAARVPPFSRPRFVVTYPFRF